MDTTILQKIADRVKHANTMKTKEIRLSIEDANELLVVIAYVTATESEELKGLVKTFLDEMKAMQPQLIKVSGGSF